MKELMKKNQKVVLFVAAVVMMLGVFLPAKQIMAKDATKEGAQLEIEKNVVVDADNKFSDLKEGYYGDPATLTAPTTPELYWWSDKNEVTVTWKLTTYYADGYEVEVSNLKGKPIATYTTGNTYHWQFKNSKVKNKGFIFRVRAFCIDDYGNKYYSNYTNKKIVIPMPNATGIKKTHKIKWQKVSGAKSYSLYRCSTKNGKYKKFKTLSKNTTSYDFGNYTGYVYVSADKVKVGKKYYNSTKPSYGLPWFYLYTTRYYY